MWILKLALGIVAVSVLVVAILYFAQTRLLFPAAQVAPSRLPLPHDVRRIAVETPDGERLVGHLAATDLGGDTGRTLVLGFGGNAWNADTLLAALRAWFPDADVAAFHYRGYRPSSGRPSARALLADALLVHDHMIAETKPERVVAVGISIGTGPAAHLAHHRKLAGAILVSPFDSLEALAREHYPWAPVGMLLRHRMPVADLLAGRSTPIAIIAGEQDSIVPPRRTEAVRQVVPTLVHDRTLPGAGHNDLYDHPDFAAAMAEALARIVAER